MFINMFRFLHPLFEAEGGGGGSDSTPVASTTPVVPVTVAVEPVITETPKHNPLRPVTIETPVTTTPAPTTIEEIDLGGRKVKVIDPVILDIAKDYKELTGTLTKETQRAKQAEDDLAALRNSIANQTPAVSTPPPTEPATTSPERMQEINDKYLEMAYEDPFGAQVWLNQQPEYQQLISPIQKQQVENVLTETQQADKARKDGLNQMRETMESKYPDFKEMVPHMQKAIEMFPSLGEKLANSPSVESLEEAYRAAKLVSGGTATPVTTPVTPATPATPTNPVVPEQPKTLEQMLADPEVIKQIIANPQITSTIISDYIKGVNGSQQNIPVMIGNQPGGAQPAIPPMEYKNTKEAGKGFRDWMRRNSTG